MIFLMVVVFVDIPPSKFPIIRFFMALSAAFFAFFFVGGVLLEGTLRGVFISATGGFALFILIQFVFDLFEVLPTPTTTTTPITQSTPTPATPTPATPTVSPSALPVAVLGGWQLRPSANPRSLKPIMKRSMNISWRDTSSAPTTYLSSLTQTQNVGLMHMSYCFAHGHLVGCLIAKGILQVEVLQFSGRGRAWVSYGCVRKGEDENEWQEKFAADAMQSLKRAYSLTRDPEVRRDLVECIHELEVL